MIKFINHLGGEMLVADERAEEYTAAGYKLAADSKAKKPAEEPTDKPVEEAKKK